MGSDVGPVGAIVSVLIVSIIALVGLQVLGAFPPVDGALSDTAEQLRTDTASALVLAVGGLGIVVVIVGMLRGMG